MRQVHRIELRLEVRASRFRCVHEGEQSRKRFLCHSSDMNNTALEQLRQAPETGHRWWAATASSIDCRSAFEVCVSEYGAGVQCPKEKKPIFFMLRTACTRTKSTRHYRLRAFATCTA